jgi:hypothetical protein
MNRIIPVGGIVVILVMIGATIFLVNRNGPFPMSKDDALKLPLDERLLRCTTPREMGEWNASKGEWSPHQYLCCPKGQALASELDRSDPKRAVFTFTGYLGTAPQRRG